jgi:putative endonuclease
MTLRRRQLGREGEKQAAQFLRRLDYDILGCNVLCQSGEIDILAQDNETLVIVEVKTKTSNRLGSPEDMVGWKKRQKLIRLAQEVSQRFPDYPIRIDVVAVIDTKISHIINAVEDER